MKIDPRGPRFGALLTTVVFVIVLITSNAWLLAAQGVVFAVASVFGMRYAPYGLIFRWLVRPRLGPPGELEDAAPPRFSQTVGLLFAIVGVLGYTVGPKPLGIVAASLGLIAAFLNAFFGLCLGCELYLIIRRIWPGRGLVPAESNKEVSL
jgi:Domain of unknown function (DUF4395)